jgi:hypothetical protein
VYVYKRNYLSCKEKLGKVSVIMETNGEVQAKRTSSSTEIPIIENSMQRCDFTGYNADTLEKLDVVSKLFLINRTKDYNKNVFSDTYRTHHIEMAFYSYFFRICK